MTRHLNYDQGIIPIRKPQEVIDTTRIHRKKEEEGNITSRVAQGFSSSKASAPLKLLHAPLLPHTRTARAHTLSLQRRKKVGNVKGLYSYRHALPKVRPSAKLDPSPISASPAPTSSPPNNGSHFFSSE